MKQSKRKRSDDAGSMVATSATVDLHALGSLVAKANEELSLSRASDSGADAKSATSIDTPAAPAAMHALSASCTVRDSLALKSALLDLLTESQPVTIDVRAVERIDTAALQVLCAFVRDRRAAGGKVLWLGCTEVFCEAIRLLGLQQVLGVLDEQLFRAAV